MTRSLTAPRQVDPLDRAIGARVAGFRVAAGMTQTELAERCGVTAEKICEYEIGHNRIPAGRLLRIARALGVDVADFYEGLEV